MVVRLVVKQSSFLDVHNKVAGCFNAFQKTQICNVIGFIIFVALLLFTRLLLRSKKSELILNRLHIVHIYFVNTFEITI